MYDVDTYPVELNTETTVFRQLAQHQMTTSDPQQPNIQHPTPPPIFFLRSRNLKPRKVKFNKEAEWFHGKRTHTEISILGAESWFPH